MAHRVVVYLAVLASLGVTADLARAVDRVKPKEGPSVVGVADASKFEVIVRQGIKTTKIPVNEIEYIVFDLEPVELQSARMEAIRGDYEAAAKTLGKVTATSLKTPDTKTEFQFYKAFISAQLAMGEGSSKAITDAGRQLMAFEKSYPDSYHYLQACELLGDLLVALGKYELAATYFEKLAEAPWPDYRLHAAMLVARSLQSQKKHREAIAKYDDILQMDASGKDAEREKSMAKLGRAVSVASSGKPDDAIKLLNQLIDKAGENESDEYYARAFNALGTCYKNAGKTKEALRAFLHTDLMYNKAPAEHAEALANLAVLWTEVNQANHSKEASKTLKERYPSSEWGKPNAVTK